ncbi:MAG: hypothetical protein FD122_431 [Stygiobacter sp.]|nr:MAG: hypothetical protein FD122_431 [Stygiobacter sp.]KAF0216906.1 MAG: hypothetical protein FD178_936 [Ignavibacteria bacterium]
MKKFTCLLLVLVFSAKSFAQEGEDVGWVARFGAAGGVSASYAFLNLDAINSQIKTLGILELSKGMFLFGGGGYAYIMIVDNVRIGGIGLSGTQSTSGRVKFLAANREVKYNYGFGGLTVEYTLPFVKNVALSIGGIIGGGSQSIEVYQNELPYTWSNSWPSSYKIMEDPFDLLQSNSAAIIKNSFFTFTPTLNLDVPINRFIALRIGGGYVMNFSDNWKINNDQNIAGVPKELSSNNFFIQTGIYFGFFAF